jgi:hypothetical protein
MVIRDSSMLPSDNRLVSSDTIPTRSGPAAVITTELDPLPVARTGVAAPVGADRTSLCDGPLLPIPIDVLAMMSLMSYGVFGRRGKEYMRHMRF